MDARMMSQEQADAAERTMQRWKQHTPRDPDDPDFPCSPCRICQPHIADDEDGLCDECQRRQGLHGSLFTAPAPEETCVCGADTSTHERFGGCPDGGIEDDPIMIPARPVPDGTVANWDTFWREVARLHRTYGTLEEES